MNKNKIVIIITISIMSMILFGVIFAQFKVVNEVNLAQIEYMSEQELKQSLIEWKEKYETTEQQYKRRTDSNKEFFREDFKNWRGTYW